MLFYWLLLENQRQQKDKSSISKKSKKKQQKSTEEHKKYLRQQQQQQESLDPEESEDLESVPISPGLTGSRSFRDLEDDGGETRQNVSDGRCISVSLGLKFEYFLFNIFLYVTMLYIYCILI